MVRFRFLLINEIIAEALRAPLARQAQHAQSQGPDSIASQLHFPLGTRHLLRCMKHTLRPVDCMTSLGMLFHPVAECLLSSVPLQLRTALNRHPRVTSIIDIIYHCDAVSLFMDHGNSNHTQPAGTLHFHGLAKRETSGVYLALNDFWRKYAAEHLRTLEVSQEAMYVFAPRSGGAKFSKMGSLCRPSSMLNFAFEWYRPRIRQHYYTSAVPVRARESQAPRAAPVAWSQTV